MKREKSGKFYRMMPKKYRLTRKDIKLFFKNSPYVVKDKFLTIFFRNNNFDNSRFAIIVPVAVSKKSTLRNNIKRKIKSVILRYNDQLPKGKDFIINVKQGFIINKFNNFPEYILNLFNKAF